LVGPLSILLLGGFREILGKRKVNSNSWPRALGFGGINWGSHYSAGYWGPGPFFGPPKIIGPFGEAVGG